MFLALFLMGIGLTVAQTQVRGTVVDEAGGPVIGATIQIKGTSQGTVTDMDGNFSLSAPSGGTLVVSYVGMRTQEVPVSANVRVEMITDTEILQELVVTGLGSATDRRKVAISVESVSEEALKRVPANSVDAALIGRIAGAQIQSTSGQPGQQANIILRGINSLGSTQPMILVDGVEINSSSLAIGTGNSSSRFADLDLSNVERVEVIQGAAAATIYGAQGANGVIQIFTKKGKVGQRTDITYTGSLSIDNALRGNLAFAKNHYYPTTSDGYIADASGNRIAVDPETGYWNKPVDAVTPTSKNDKPFKEETYDHIDQYFKKNVITHSHALNVVGAAEKIDYALSLAYMDQESPIHGKYDKKNITANIGSEIFKGFTIRSITQLIASKNTTGGINNRNNIYSGLGSALLVPSFVDLTYTDASGNPPVNWEVGNSVMPFYTYKYRDITADIMRVIQGINLNYKINKFVELDYKYGVDHYRYDYNDFIANQQSTNTPGAGIPPLTGNLEKRQIQETQQNSLLSTFLRFDLAKDFNMDFPLQSTTQIAYDWRRNDYERLTGTGTGFGLYPPFTITTAGTKTASDNISKFITFGYLVNQKFDYADLMGTSIGFRSDYSSAFGEGSKPFTFPRADFYFRLSEILKNPSIYEMKLRMAYGEAGIQPAAYDRLITLKSDVLGDQSYFYLPGDSDYPSRNPQLGVERTRETEFGLDYGISLHKGAWLNKVSGSLVYWTRKSTGTIYQIGLPPSSGAAAIQTNAIDLSSNGIQLSMDLDVYKSKSFDWTFGARFSKGKTIVDNIANHLPIVIGAGGSGQTSLVEGEPVGAFYGVSPLTSIDQTNSAGERYIAEADASNYELVEGMVVNKTSKQVQFTNEQAKIGDATPDFSMSFFNDFTLYKNLTFSFQLDWVKGAQAYNVSRQFLYRDKIHADFDKEVTIGGETGAWVAYHNSLYNTNEVNSFFVEDASFLRLRNISLSYDFAPLLKNNYVRGLLFTVSARNLLTFTPYSGLDPEAVGTRLNDPLYRGIDLWSIPNTRSINLGLTLRF
ncbi:SusC/RagA family TonB-linked outer membrane protein [Proteiniphilum sp. X52]|nr:SusC/RagA family TonB-linked outer membrane protein [Proteiniphilum sp. X52]